MIEIQLVKEMDEGRPIKSHLKWSFNGRLVSLDFPYAISCLVSNSLKKIVVEIFEIREIRLLDFDGGIYIKLNIPDVKGYQFRGINPNSRSVTGVSLLYAPIAKDVGNEWGDVEQYEFIVDDFIKGQMLGIHR